jgi:hypothetical protein
MQYEEGIRQFNEEIARLKAKDEEEHKMEIQKLELQKQQLEEEKRQFDEQMALTKSKMYSSGSGGTGGTGGTGTNNKDKNGTGGTNNKTKTDPTMQSILALGYGPISASELNRLVDSGEVEEYYENGVQKFRKVAKKTKQFTASASQLYPGYTESKARKEEPKMPSIFSFKYGN